MKLKIFVGCLIMVIIFSCRKETFTNDPDVLLTTDIDTLHFDTVFTTTGSITQSFKIMNDNSKGIHIGTIKLAGGAASPFKININGQPDAVSNLDINANDSAYVFVSVHIDPTSSTMPFVVRDSIEVAYNGNQMWVQLEAFGQNAHFYRNRSITGHEEWNNDLPYVILDKLVIADHAQLTINKGCKIYVHANAPFIVNGTLQVKGEKWDSTRVVFSGDRLDDPYRDFPSSWPGIVFTDNSTNNSIQYSTIKNAYQGLVVQNPAVNFNPKLSLSETIIDNAYDAGIMGMNTSIVAQNVLISNCGKNVVITSGGDYQFTHCTIAAYANTFMQHKDPVLQVGNYLNGNNVYNLTAIFRNCIFWGEGGGVKNEVVVDKAGSSLFNVLFDHVLWPLQNDPENSTVIKAINDTPEFDSINTIKHYYNFRLKETSPALNTGVNTGITIDLDGNKRPVALPDLGAYERQ